MIDVRPLSPILPPPRFQVIHDRYEAGSRLVVSGDCDAHTAPHLRTALADTMKSSAIIEVLLDNVGFMDSSGLATLIAARQTALEAEQQLSVTSVSPQVGQLFVRAGLAVDFGWPTFSPAELGTLCSTEMFDPRPNGVSAG